MREALLAYDQATFSYTPDTPLLRNISFKIEEGEVVGLLGPNGAGKTTLIKLLIGLFKPNQGQVLIKGQSPYDHPGLRFNLGVMHQAGAFDQMLNGWDNLYIAGRFYNLRKRDVERRVDELTPVVGDLSCLTRPAITFSGGQHRRAQILRAMLHKPKFLVLDEPTVALDVEGRYTFYKSIKDLIAYENITVIWTTHYLEEVENTCKRIILLNEGKIILDKDILDLKISSSSSDIKLIFQPDDTQTLYQVAQELAFLVEVDENSCLIKDTKLDVFYKQLLPKIIGCGLEPVSISRREASLEEIYLKALGPKNQAAEKAKQLA